MSKTFVLWLQYFLKLLYRQTLGFFLALKSRGKEECNDKYLPLLTSKDWSNHGEWVPTKSHSCLICLTYCQSSDSGITLGYRDLYILTYIQLLRNELSPSINPISWNYFLETLYNIQRSELPSQAFISNHASKSIMRTNDFISFFSIRTPQMIFFYLWDSVYLRIIQEKISGF